MKQKFHIPNPCSEDWNKMNPTQKGAFCDKCQIDVIDFTKKSPEDIRSILEENSGRKTCGHITKSQIDMVNTNFHVWKNQSISIFRSKFLYACVMVFGFTLFTGCTTGSPDNNEEIEETVNGGMEADDTIMTCDSTLIEDEFIKMGDFEPIDGEMMEDIE